jgi:hypothetical protein
LVLKILKVLVRRVAVAVSTWVTMDVGDAAGMPGFVVGDGHGQTSSVANSLQNFSANPEEKFDR